MATQALLRDTIRLSTPCFPSLDKSMGNAKRYAIYIPESFFENARRRVIAEADAASTWEFSAAVSPSTSIYSESTSSPPSSPAQEIVIRYRAGMPLQLEGSEPRSNIPVDDPDDDDDDSLTFCTPIEGFEGPPGETLMTEIENTEIKLIYRQSCQQGLSKTREEAFQAMQTRGLREVDSIACQRSGCPDTLRSPKDLMFHLHIHDIHDGLARCSRCQRFYENQRELDVHQCSDRRVRSFVAPLRSILTRILSKLARRK